MSKPDIKSLFDVANEVVDEFATVLRTTLKIAKRGGDALVAIKEATPHGEFTNALRTYFKGSVETARVWMRVSREWNWLVQLYDGDIDNVCIDGARAALARKETIEPRAIKGEMEFTRSAVRVRQDLKRDVAQKLAALNDREVEILGEIWETIWLDNYRGILAVTLTLARLQRKEAERGPSITPDDDKDDWYRPEAETAKLLRLSEQSELAWVHRLAEEDYARFCHEHCYPPPKPFDDFDPVTPNSVVHPLPSPGYSC